MSTKKIITVFGATGKQGGSVVQTFLHDPKLKDEWTVRGVSRNVDGAAAKKLASQGVEMVAVSSSPVQETSVSVTSLLMKYSSLQADLDDKASLVEALTGAYAAFTVTNYWEKMDMQVEITQGKNLADAAKEADVEIYIWSSLLNINKREKPSPLQLPFIHCRFPYHSPHTQ